MRRLLLTSLAVLHCLRQRIALGCGLGPGAHFSSVELILRVLLSFIQSQKTSVILGLLQSVGRKVLRKRPPEKNHGYVPRSKNGRRDRSRAGGKAGLMLLADPVARARSGANAMKAVNKRIARLGTTFRSRSIHESAYPSS